MDDSLMDCVFEEGDDSDFAQPVKAVKAAKPKAAAPKKSATVGKPRGRPPKDATQTKPKTTKVAPKKKRKADPDDENSDVDIDEGPFGDDSDEALLADTPPKQRKPSGPKRTSGKPLANIANESFDVDGVDDALVEAPKRGSNSASDRYQMLTHLEHIMKRPDTYIGSVERTDQKMWVYNSTTESMEFREVGYVPGLYKIFDEILVNAADNKQNDKNMSEIRVTVDRESGEISVRNDGRGIPVEIHKEHGIYVPEMIFGHLLTSSNYNDDQQKITGGRNGYGAKLCNVFSTEFTVETVDSRQKKKYKQTWTQNMSKMGKAKITDHKSDDYTKVTYKADFSKFGMAGMDDDFEALVKRRTYDMAGTVRGVKVYLNGERVKISSFAKYMEMYTKAIAKEQGKDDSQEKGKEVIITDKHERWDIGFAVSDGSFNQVSFVNSIATTSGGTHVNFIAEQIVDKLMDMVKKKNKGGYKLKPAQIKNHIFLFVNCQIINPAFTSQTKEQLTTKSSQFGSKPVVSDKFLKQIEKTEVIQNILHFAQQKADQLLKKTDGNKRSRMSNSKLTDANKAGTKDGYHCTLILTEGDSAALLALAGRAVVNPDLFGVFPLRGKLLNVRDASIDQISKNQEIQNIKKFIGLQHKKEYTDTRGLRYGHIMIMTDQDHDGSHIKGLLINFLQCQFPSLLKIPGFLLEFITPIVKVWKGDPKHPKNLKSFYSMPEYEEWKEQHKNEKWEHKYFKGLGTSSISDAQVYFKDLDTHLKEFHTMQAEEEGLIELAFSKKKADARKEWLRDFVPGNHLDLTTNRISYDDFVNKELILFSIADNLRSIPSVVDGFKPGQRKVLYTCLRRNLKKDVKVVDLAGSVSGTTDYAYGESSMQGTIIGLAQTFVGSNNINCLEPSGNFGSRLQGGADAASARYIYTRLSPFARRVFHPHDDALLKYGESDGNKIEPEMYVPIIPMVLVNGADGIGTGWSSSIPNYNPMDIIENLRIRMAEGATKEDMKPMIPWFRGFTGQTEDIGGDRFKFTGTIRQTGDNEVEITELPVRYWTQDFKDRLEDIIKADKSPSFIKDYTEYNTPDRVHFIIKMEDKHMANALAKGLEETFKLAKTMATSNLVAFDAQGRIHKYATVLDIMEEFYHIRLRYYEKRKSHQLDELQKELEKLSNQSRFIKMIIDGKLVVSKKKKAVLVAELQKLGFKPIPKVADAKKAGELEEIVEEEEEEGEVAAGANDFDYLLGMAIYSLTQERIEKLMKQIGDKELEIDALIRLTPKDIWNHDLDAFVDEWNAQLDEEAAEAKRLLKMGRRASQKLGIGASKGKGKKKRKHGDSGSDDGSDSDFGPTKKKAATSKSKPGGILGYLTNKDPPQRKASATEALKRMGSSGSIPPKPNDPFKYLHKKEPTPSTDGGMDVGAPAPVPATKRGRPAGSKNPKKTTAVLLESEDDDSDVFAAVAKEAEKKPAETITTSRTARGATKKATNYVIDDDSDSDDLGGNLLDDVSSMVKTIGGGAGDRPLFSTTTNRPSSGGNTRPGSSATTSKIPGRLGMQKSSPTDLDDDDETNYEGLLPRASPEKPAPRNVNDTIMASDDDDDFGFGIKAASSRVTSKPVAKPVAKPVKPASKAAVKNSKAAEKPKTTAPAVVAKKNIQLSPAAKAYATKLSKVKETAPSKTKPAPKNIIDSDEMEDADALANDILSDEDDDVPTPKPRAAASRPGRRAAAAKAKYTLKDSDEDDESEDEASEADFDDDSE